jgi:hypothetical protein
LALPWQFCTPVRRFSWMQDDPRFGPHRLRSPALGIKTR